MTLYSTSRCGSLEASLVRIYLNHLVSSFDHPTPHNNEVYLLFVCHVQLILNCFVLILTSLSTLSGHIRMVPACDKGLYVEHQTMELPTTGFEIYIILCHYVIQWTIQLVLFISVGCTQQVHCRGLSQPPISEDLTELCILYCIVSSCIVLYKSYRDNFVLYRRCIVCMSGV